jgi:alkylhydroperoxidase family enzyme
MKQRRALIAAASAVAVIATGTAAAAANFGLLGTNDKQLPAGHLDLAAVNATASLGSAATVAGTIRVELEDGVIHIFQADGTEITVPMPTSTSDQTTTVASAASATESGDDQPEPSTESPPTTAHPDSATSPSASTPHHDEPGEPPEHDDD